MRWLGTLIIFLVIGRVVWYVADSAPPSAPSTWTAAPAPRALPTRTSIPEPESAQKPCAEEATYEDYQACNYRDDRQDRENPASS
jgi:hypothetical protein